MTRSELLQFMRSQRYAVQASVSSSGAPQAAAVGIAVTDDLCLIFDTLDTTRKACNLRQNYATAFVIGGSNDGDERRGDRSSHVYFSPVVTRKSHPCRW